MIGGLSIAAGSYITATAAAKADLSVATGCVFAHRTSLSSASAGVLQSSVLRGL